MAAPLLERMLFRKADQPTSLPASAKKSGERTPSKQPRSNGSPYQLDMPLEDIIRLRSDHMGRNTTFFFKDSPLVVVKSQGQYLYDEAGNKYLDCINNVAHIGHCHPHWSRAVSNQLSTQATNVRYLHPAVVELAQRLARTFDHERTGLSVCYFVNSGSEANDLALRMAEAHTGASDVIALEHAYHGILTSLTAFSPYKYAKLSMEERIKRKLPPDWVHLAPCPDTYRGPIDLTKNQDETAGTAYFNALNDILRSVEARGRRVGMFIAESIQSCGGQIVYPPDYLERAYAAVRAHGGICVADEVQCGFGRVGSHYWGFQSYGEQTVPDIVVIGKSMGNGFPIAAVVTRPDIAESFSKTWPEFFSTFGGNPASATAALAVMDVVESEELQKHAHQVGTWLIDRLRSQFLIPGSRASTVVGDIRGRGLMIGIEIIVPGVAERLPNKELAHAIKADLLARDRIVISTDGPDDNVLKIKPPMCFSMKDASRLVDGLERCLLRLLN